MRKIVAFTSVSLDGYFEGPNREIDWSLMDEEFHTYINEVLGSMGAFLNGRLNYEIMDAFWPTADQAPDASPTTLEFARVWRETPKYVYSRTLQDAPGATRVFSSVDPAEVQALKEQPGGDMVVGGASLVTEFRRLGLIDEYRLHVHPVVIGKGRPFFEDVDEKLSLKLVETRAFPIGVVLLRYQKPDA